MNSLKVLIHISTTLFLAPLALGAGLSARDIMVKNDEVQKVQTVESKAHISTTGGSAKEHVKDFTWWRKLTSDGQRFNTLTRFQSPAEVKGEGILFLEQEKGKADVQLYLPNFKKIRRVEEQQQSGSFMGSEFSYSDIATPHVDDFTYKLIKEEPCPPPGDKTQRCSVVETTPATDAVKERTGASRGLSWIRPDNFMAVRGEYFDLENKPWKRMEASEFKEIDPKLHKWMALNVVMENSKTGRRTVLHFENVKANQSIADSTFTPQNLAREKMKSARIFQILSLAFVLLGVFLGTQSAFSQEEASSERLFGLSGKMMGDAYVPTVPPPASKTFEQLSSTIQLQADLHLFEHSSGRVTYQGKIFDGNNSNITGDTSVTHMQSILREGYYQFSAEGWDVRAGKQIISWGKSDAVNPTDFLTARDFSHFQPDDEDRRLGGTGLWVSHTFDHGNSPVNLVAVWNLIYPQSKLLFPPASNLPTGIALYDPQSPPTGINNSELAAKISYAGQQWDASLSFFSGFNHTPQLQEISHGIGAQGLVVNVGQVYRHMTAVGADGSMSVRAWVFRVESAYSITENGDGTNPLYIPNHLDSVIGAERSLGGDFRIQVQGVWRYFPLLTSADQITGSDPVSTGVSQQIARTNALLSQYQLPSRTSGTVRISYNSEQNGFDAEIFLLQNLDGGDYLLRPIVTYRWSDSLKTSLGSELFGGPSSRPLGVFNSFSSVFSEVKYVF